MKPRLDSLPELVGIRSIGGLANESKAPKGSLSSGSGTLQLSIEAASVTSRDGRRRGVVPIERGGSGGTRRGRAKPGEFVTNSSSDGKRGVI